MDGIFLYLLSFKWVQLVVYKLNFNNVDLKEVMSVNEKRIYIS